MFDLTVTADPAAILPDTASLQDGANDLDLRGLHCPMPVLRTRKALAGLPSGALLRVSCTDPLAGLDIPHLLNGTDDVLVSAEQAGPVLVFLIRKS